MSSFAIFVLIVIIIAGALGWRSGLIKQIGKLVGIVLGIVACRLFAPQVLEQLCPDGASGTDNMLYTVLTYVVVFLVVYIGVAIIAYLMRNIIKAVSLGGLDRLGGAVFNITEWLLFLSLILNVWEAYFPITSLADDPFYTRVLWFGPALLGMFSGKL